MWELNHKEGLALKNQCFLTGCWRRLLRVPWIARSNQSILKEISPIHWKDWCWNWSSNTLTTWCKELTQWKRPWCWEKIDSGRRRGRQLGWDGWVASLTQCTWVWVSSGSWWWTGRPGVLQSMELQRVGHDSTELNWLYLLLWARIPYKKYRSRHNQQKCLKYNTCTLKNNRMILFHFQGKPSTSQ